MVTCLIPCWQDLDSWKRFKKPPTQDSQPGHCLDSSSSIPEMSIDECRSWSAVRCRFLSFLLEFFDVQRAVTTSNLGIFYFTLLLHYFVCRMKHMVDQLRQKMRKSDKCVTSCRMSDAWIIIRKLCELLGRAVITSLMQVSNWIEVIITRLSVFRVVNNNSSVSI